jgi:hypothetical protein
MELNLSELNTMNPYETFDYNSYEQQNGMNYWERPKVEEKEKRKKVSFDDILSNMNLVVNKQGVLQYMMPNQTETYNQEYNYNTNEFRQQGQQGQKVQQIQQLQGQQTQKALQSHYEKQVQYEKQTQPIDQSVKHSYIYNKYFKDYVNPNAGQQQPRVPKTIEEYHQMLREERMKFLQHRKMIEQVKSTKMMFTSSPNASLDPRNINASKNNLRMMNFR